MGNFSHIIIVDKDVAHCHHIFPRCLWVTVSKSGGKIIGCLANDFYVLHDAIIYQHVGTKVVQRHVFRVVLNTLDCCLDVFQSGTVSNLNYSWTFILLFVKHELSIIYH